MLGIADPVWTTECMASKKTAPAVASMPNASGISSTSATLPPMPGIAPKTAPVSTATVISAMSSGELTRATRLARTGATLAPS